MQFYVDGPEMLADFIVPVSPKQARIMFEKMAECGGQLYAAIYWTPPGQTKRGATAIYLQRDSESTTERNVFVGVDEYHPRKNGKAQIEFKEFNPS